MSRCWTCGSEFEGGWLFTCPKCQIITRGFQDVREIANASKVATEKLLDFFLKALETNPLDYQIYIGLGRMYLCLSQFGKAEKCFLDSLSHAPKKGDFDYKSYSFRLVARVKYCGVDIDSAISYAEQAVSLSPNYWKVYYDLAQYCTVKGDLSKSADALRKAIESEKLYFPMAENERDFVPVRNVLEDMRNEAKAIANWAIAEAADVLQKAEDADAQVYVSAEYENAKSKLHAAKNKMAVGTYEAFSEAKDLASETRTVANTAKEKARERRLALQADLKPIHIYFGLAFLFLTFAFIAMAFSILSEVKGGLIFSLCMLVAMVLYFRGIGSVWKSNIFWMWVVLFFCAWPITIPVSYLIALKKAKNKYKDI